MESNLEACGSHEGHFFDSVDNRLEFYALNQTCSAQWGLGSGEHPWSLPLENSRLSFTVQYL